MKRPLPSGRPCTMSPLCACEQRQRAQEGGRAGESCDLSDDGAIVREALRMSSACSECSSSFSLTFLPSIPDSRSFAIKTGTTTRGCAGGCSKVRLDGPNRRREKSWLAVLFDRMKKKCDAAPLFSLSRHDPSPRATPTRPSFSSFLADNGSPLCAPCFAAILKRKRPRKGGSERAANEKTGQRCRLGSFAREKRNFQAFRGKKTRPSPPTSPRGRGTRLPQGRGLFSYLIFF